FCEHLTLAVQPPAVEYKRIRVQARQLYVFSQAARAGWMSRAPKIDRQGGEFLMRFGCDVNRQICLRSLAVDGRPYDTTVDLYDNSFSVFALANWYRMGGDPRLLR